MLFIRLIKYCIPSTVWWPFPNTYIDLILFCVFGEKSKKSITLEGVVYELSTTEKVGCRFVQVDNVTYIEQNKKKNTIYAEMANQVQITSILSIHLPSQLIS